MKFTHKCPCGNIFGHNHLASTTKEYWDIHTCPKCKTIVTECEVSK